jgi:hypothetical protein
MAQARTVDISQFFELEPGSFVPLWVQLAERTEETMRGSCARYVLASHQPVLYGAV